MNTSTLQQAWIGRFHTARGFLRTIAAIVLVTFVTLNLQPLAVAVQTSSSRTPPEPQGLSDKLQALKETVHRANTKIVESSGGTFDLKADLDSAMQGGRLLVQEDLDKTVDQILEQAEAIDTEHEQALEEFDRIGQWIQDQDLPPIIQQRHEDAVVEYQAKYNTYKQHMEALSNSTESKAQQQAIQDLHTFLEAQQFQRSHQPFDPENLPFRVPDGKVREPATTPEQFQQLGLIQDKPIQVAATELSPMMLAQADDLPGPEHLAPTIDVQITQAIQDKAEELNHHPVEIYNWVRNTIEFLPTYGSIQGSHQTLGSLKGNAFDTASLLIALLRASDIPARYVYGTVEIPIEQVMNWVGGVETPEAALQLLGQGGIPTTGLTSGGQFVAARIEHVWVEAWVDFIPSRGAINKQGDTWVPMDGSFKQYTYIGGLEPSSLDEVDVQQSLQEILSDANINVPERWISEINLSTFEAMLIDARSQLSSTLDQNDQYLMEKRIVRADVSFLSTGLPFRLNTIGSRPHTLDAFRQYLWFEFFGSERERVLDNPVFSFSRSLPQLAGKRLAMIYEPESQSDRDVIERLLPNASPDEPLDISSLPDTLPGYLIQVRAKLLIDDDLIEVGGPFTLGQDLSSTIEISKLTGGKHVAVNPLTAGEAFVIGLDLATYAPGQFQKDTGRHTLSVLYQTSIAYFATLDSHLNMLRGTRQAVAYRHPSFGFFGTRILSELYFGLPRNVTLNGARLDVDAVVQSVITEESRTTLSRTNQQIGLLISKLEQEIPTSYLASETYPSTGVSSVGALVTALSGGQRVFSIDSSNVSAVMPLLTVSRDAKDDIARAVTAGFEATVSEHNVLVGSWNGVGYILTDPETGSGAYRISGGTNGGETQDGFAKGMAYVGLGVLVDFVVPPAYADGGAEGPDEECGQQDDIDINWGDVLAWVLLAVILITILLLTRQAAPVLAGLAIVLIWFIQIAPAIAGETGCPKFIIGQQSSRGVPMDQIVDHTSIAQSGSSPTILTYLGPGNRQDSSWVNNIDICNKESREEFIRAFNVEPDCDEYPYAAVYEGGKLNYGPPNQFVSLRLVSRQQNRAQGGALNQFLRRCDVNRNGRFEVIVDSQAGGETRGVDEHGNRCY